MPKQECKSLCRLLAEGICRIAHGGIPGGILDYAKGRVLDIVGAAIAGSSRWEYAGRVTAGLLELEGGCSTVIGRRERLGLGMAALMNTAFAHALELDDGHRNAGVHAGAVVIPTALAVGERLHASGAEVLEAIVLGYDVVYRLARNLNPAQIRKGFHPSATCGAFGAAAAAARLLRLGPEEVANALGLAGLQAAGLMEAAHSAPSTKCIMVGHASFAGIVSAWLAARNVPGAVTVLEGEAGVFRLMGDGVDPAGVTAGLGERFEITDTYTKLYPSCRHTHPAIEGLVSLLEEHAFAAEDVERVTVGTHQVAADLTAGLFRPGDAGGARFSMPYSIAVVLREGSFSLSHLDARYLNDPGVRRLAELVRVVVDEEVDRVFPRQRGARVEVVLKDGRRFEKTTYVLRGSPELPVGWDVLHRKFMDCAVGVTSETRASEVVEMVHGLEKMDDVSRLTEELTL